VVVDSVTTTFASRSLSFSSIARYSTFLLVEECAARTRVGFSTAI
jgi:hypothetical protein